jgi:ABC-type multidrug transport system ATPase subunit
MWSVAVNAIEVNDLARSFGKIDAVKGVSFAIPEGEVLGFLGPSCA